MLNFIPGKYAFAAAALLTLCFWWIWRSYGLTAPALAMVFVVISYLIHGGQLAAAAIRKGKTTNATIAKPVPASADSRNAPR